MSRKVCALVAALCCLSGFIEVIPHTCIIYNYSCYTSNVVKHFFSDILPIMRLTCSDISLLKFWIITDHSSIYFYQFCYTQGPFQHWQTEGLLHMFLCSHSGYSSLCYSLLSIFITSIRRILSFPQTLFTI